MTSIHDPDPGSRIRELDRALECSRSERDWLAMRRDELEAVVAAAQVGFAHLDAGTRALAANVQFKSEFGFPPDAHMGLPDLLDRLHSEDRELIANAVADALTGGAEFDATVRIERSDGTPRFIALRGRVIRNEAGRVERLLVTSRNVSAETLAAAAQRRQADACIEHEHRLRDGAEAANRAKDDFLALISHDLRSPLNAILGWNRILLLKRGEDDEVAAIAPRIEHSARAQLKLVNDLLDLAHIGAGKLRIEPRPLRLAKVIANAVEAARAAASRKGLALSVELAEDLQPTRGDPDRLQQVTAHLLSNAIKFTPPAGRIAVGLRNVSGCVELSIADTGRGIGAAELAQLFDRFRTDRPQSPRSGGLGLGLALVREIVNLHGGTVSASSAGVGAGSTFVVQLPGGPRVGVDLPAAVGAPLEASHQCRLGGLSILVVDDEPDARTVVAESLRLEGARVTVSDSAAAAFQHLTAGTHFDIVVSDIGMPDEDGYSLVRRLRALQSDRRTLAIAVTGFVSQSDVTAAMDAGFDVHVPKPVDFETFVPMVRRLAAAASA